MFCGNCGKQLTDNFNQCPYCGKKINFYTEQGSTMTDGKIYKNEVLTRVIITIISCIVIFGIEILLIESNSLVIGSPVFVIFGWKSLTRIQPRMFLWMPLAHWLMYFFVKFLLAFLVGVFVTPFVIGNRLGKILSGSI